jgi:CheY-like chemotaxis protein
MSKKLRILLVEDDHFLLKVMRLKFEKSGFLVRTAESGEQALQLMKTWIPTAVILDILMPGMNGYDVLKIIKTTPEWRGIPVIIASNLSGERDVNKGMDLSAAEFITKSDLSLEELVDKTMFFIQMSAHGQRFLAGR